MQLLNNIAYKPVHPYNNHVSGLLEASIKDVTCSRSKGALYIYTIFVRI
jgi:hypothetical protein